MGLSRLMLLIGVDYPQFDEWLAEVKEAIRLKEVSQKKTKLRKTERSKSPTLNRHTVTQ